MPVGGVHWRVRKVHEAVDHLYRGASSFQRSSITVGHGNPFPMLWGGRRGSSRIQEGMKQQMPESPSLGFHFNHPIPGTLQAAHCSCNSDNLHPKYSWPADQCTKYFHAAGENTSGKSCCMKADVTTQTCQNCQVLVGRWHTPHNYWPPTGAGNFTRFLVGTTMATMLSMWLWQDTMMGTTYVDTMTASMSLVSLGPTPMAVGCPTATLEDVTEWESED